MPISELIRWLNELSMELATIGGKSLLVLVIAALIAWMMTRQSAAWQHEVWAVAIVVVLLLPAVSTLLPNWVLVIPREFSQADVTVAYEEQAQNPSESTYLEPSRIDGVSPLSQPEEHRSTSNDARRSAESTGRRPEQPWQSAGATFCFIWLTGVCVLLLRFGWHQWRLHVMFRDSYAATDDRLLAAFNECQQQIGVGAGTRDRRIHLRLTKNLEMPTVWGVLRPTLLLPHDAVGWSSSILHSVLKHELAHVKRREPLVAWLSQLAAAVYWFNPLIWYACWQVSVQREQACDDMVLSLGARPSDYARDLFEVATRYSIRTAPAGGAAMAQSSRLEQRLRAILGERKRNQIRSIVRCLVLLLVVTLSVPIAALRAASDPSWTIKVVAKDSALPVPQAKIIIYPGGKDRGPDNKHEFTTDQRGRATIPAIHYERTDPDDDASIIVEFNGERRADVSCGPELLAGNHDSAFVIAMSGSKRIDPESAVAVELQTDDFRKKHKNEFWQLRISGRVPEVPAAAAEWWGHLDPVKKGDDYVLRGNVPRGLRDAKLHLDSPLGVALIYEEPERGQRHSGAEVDLGTLDANRTGELSFYDGAYIIVRVLDPAGDLVNDARVDGFIRSCVVTEYHANFRPLQGGTEGKYTSPPLVAPFAVAAIRVTHPKYADVSLEASDLQRGETRNVDIQLKPATPAGQADENQPEAKPLSKFARKRAKMEVVKPGRPIAEPESLAMSFGPPIAGLRAALVLEPNKLSYAIGDKVKCRFLVQNKSNRPIQFSTLTWSQDARGEAHDQNGNKIQIGGTLYTGMAPHAHYRLAPGDGIEIESADIGIGDGKYDHPVGDIVKAAVGQTCRLRYHVSLPGVQIRDGEGRVLVPAQGEWIGTLATGEVEFKVVAPSKESP